MNFEKKINKNKSTDFNPPFENAAVGMTITSPKAELESIKAACINQETGEFDQDRYDKDRMELLLSIAVEIKELKNEVEAFRYQEKVLADKRAESTNKMESKRNLLSELLNPNEKINGKLAKISISEKESPVYDTDRIPDRYYKIKWEIDKDRIKKEAEKGEKIPGFSLQKKSVLTIR